jgi:hypothetical protein
MIFNDSQNRPYTHPCHPPGSCGPVSTCAARPSLCRGGARSRHWTGCLPPRAVGAILPVVAVALRELSSASLEGRARVQGCHRTSCLVRKPRILFIAMQASPEAITTADRRPLPDDLNVLREIIGGRPADPQTMLRLITCNLVEEFDGTALLTTRGIKAASLLSPTK